MGIIEDAQMLEQLIAQLSRLNATNNDLITTLRWHAGGLLYAGMCRPEVQGAWKRDWTIPFASVAFADVGGNGLNISTGTGAESQGPGVVVAPANTAACVPLVGRNLVVTPAGSTDGGVFFLAVFTKLQPFSWCQI